MPRRDIAHTMLPPWTEPRSVVQAKHSRLEERRIQDLTAAHTCNARLVLAKRCMVIMQMADAYMHAYMLQHLRGPRQWQTGQATKYRVRAPGSSHQTPSQAGSNQVSLNLGTAGLAFGLLLAYSLAPSNWVSSGFELRPCPIVPQVGF